MDAIQTITSAQGVGVNTVPPSNPANVSPSVIGNTMHFLFNLPQGEVGPTGEVSANDLSNAISGTSNNSNNVSTLGGPMTATTNRRCRTSSTRWMS